MMEKADYVDHVAVTDDAEPNLLLPALLQQAPRRLSQAMWTMALSVLPIVLWLTLGGTAVSPMNGIDEYIYIGAVERLRDFLLRWPDTYYTARFGYLIPEWTAERIFGPSLGYFAVRFLLLGVVAAACSLRGRINGWAAALGVVVLISPIVVSAVFNTYTLSFAVLFLMCGASLLSGAPARGAPAVVTLLMGGAALSMSWNAHFTSLPLCLVIMFVFGIDVAVEFRSDIRSVLLSWGSLAVGATVVVLGGMAIYRWKFGVSDLYGSTIRQAQQDTNSVFLDRGYVWLTWRPYLLLGPLSVGVGIAVWRATTEVVQRRAIRRLVWFTSSSWVVFSYFQWVRHDALLAIFYYSSLPLSLSLITLARAVSITAARVRRGLRAISVIGAAAAMVATWLWLDAVKPEYWFIVLVSFATALGVIVLFRSERYRFLAVSALLIVASWTTVAIPHTFPGASKQFRVDPFYDRILFQYNYSGLDTLEVVRDFARSLPVLPQNRGQILVWFDSSGPMNQVLSAMVHYRSALQSPSGPAMPEYDAFVVDRLTSDRPRYIVILDADRTDVDRGIGVLQDLAPYRLVSQKDFRSGTYVASVALLERSDGRWRDFPCAGPGNQAVLCP